jgi:hypothetical protein
MKSLQFEASGPLEGALVGGILLAVLGAFMNFAVHPWFAVLTAAIMAGLAYARLTTNCDYDFDPARQQLIFRRNLLGNRIILPVADFTEAFATSTTSRQQTRKNWSGGMDDFFSYASVVVLKNGKQIRFTDFRERDHQYPKLVAQQVADALDVPFVEAPNETRLVIRGNEGSGQPLLQHSTMIPHSLLRAWALFALFVAALIACAVLRVWIPAWNTSTAPTPRGAQNAKEYPVSARGLSPLGSLPHNR